MNNFIKVLKDNMDVDLADYKNSEFEKGFYVKNLFKMDFSQDSKEMRKIKEKLLAHVNNIFQDMVNKTKTHVSMDELIFKANWKKAYLNLSNKNLPSFDLDDEQYLFNLNINMHASNIFFKAQGLNFVNNNLILPG